MGTFRKPVNKSQSARKFRKNVSKTKAANIPSRKVLMRGGQRM
ncbi:MAG: hypothetical protein [Arizlama microvirus]|nr:MAG: hypothetical protein [Arizlama microvirus]